ncbi:cation:proton antiporter [Streptomyces sp. NPDC057271]|uniref:cation:proton antiporter domain-containing protein n=1 Tax=unclassified Streptomyces TaxID=2593676 RepID=UPI0036313050
MVALTGGAAVGGWKLLLLVPYGLTVALVVRPLFRRVLDRWEDGEGGGGVLPWVLAGLLLSGGFTEWIGLHLVFGCFAFGAALPNGRSERLRRELLVRIEPLTTQLLLPVYFVLAGLKVDLSGAGTAGVAELVLITVVAVAAKMAGAYAGGRGARLAPRPSSTVALLMNTRGLTELVVLTVGLELGLLDAGLYSLMVAMAVVTTAMTGPLLSLLGHHRTRGRGPAARPDASL